MPKINALPPMTAPDGDDVFAADDVSTTNKDTKKLSLTGLKEWLQSLAGWITTAMLGDSQINASKIDWSTSGEIWWEELGRTANTNQSSVGVTTIPARKYLQVKLNCSPSTTLNLILRFNNDSGNNYSWRAELNGAADTTGSSTSGIELGTAISAPTRWITIDILNISAQEKAVTAVHTTPSIAGAANIASKQREDGKWANTSTQITRIDVVASTGNLGTAEIVILGHN